ncbi:palmitoyl-acyl carrier protein thioesterase, chloroplastic-like [Olea europaea var. sylvestris]|uniref:palmitoyl-acyl carrier protein thioesterase, chloroplastic-like n=1 Tax=Olea europaea var. sylvestris TaxID=158386 RepID=UPI000C1D5279|nr:palmitoyl-acyl carrier protein thioesterase, chloroplastic-like [Olea europaea var. sylvestris]
MACVSFHLAFYTWCSTNRKGQEKNKRKLNCVKINGTDGFSPSKVDLLSQNGLAITSVDSEANVCITKEQFRQNIPTKKQLVDPFRQGVIIEEEVRYRQTVVIRSNEVGPDKTATIESILNLLQETALNHVWMSGLLGDGFGATHGMMRNNLIWVVSRMQVQVDHYPIWGEVMEIDTWVGSSGKNGMRRDWLLGSKATGVVFARATSTWVMMNQRTRRLSKMPDEVRAEISPWFIDKQAIKEESPEKIDKLDDNARYVNSDLKPKRSDLDMNHHVNNVKYVRWMLEAIPDEFLENHQLTNITLEYRRECGSSDVVQSLCEPQQLELISAGIQQNNYSCLNGYSFSSGILEGNGLLGPLNQWPFSYTHLLQIKGDAKNEEIVRGKTKWKKKLISSQFSP